MALGRKTMPTGIRRHFSSFLGGKEFASLMLSERGQGQGKGFASLMLFRKGKSQGKSGLATLE